MINTRAPDGANNVNNGFNNCCTSKVYLTHGWKPSLQQFERGWKYCLVGFWTIVVFADKAWVRRSWSWGRYIINFRRLLGDTHSVELCAWWYPVGITHHPCVWLCTVCLHQCATRLCLHRLNWHRMRRLGSAALTVLRESSQQATVHKKIMFN